VADTRHGTTHQRGSFPARGEVAAVTDVRIRHYLAGLLRAAAEVVEQPRLLPVFLGILTTVPATLRQSLAHS
jgi:hypothetical protein